MRQATLQEQYNLIVEGKGNINAFHKQALKQFPHLFTAQSSFDQVVTVLKQKSIISEMVAQGLVSNSTGPNFFEIFNTNMAKLNEEVKAEEKKVSKEVEQDQSHNYDYKNKKSIDNHSGAEFLLGFYVESRNAKNVDKTVEQIKDIVVKNLAKNPLHYVESGQFGVEGLGYKDEAPGLGKTKEVTGKYKSSGMEPVKLSESLDEIGMFNDPRTSSSFKNDADKWENGALHVRIQMLKNRGITSDEAKELATTHENKPWEEVKKLLNLNEIDTNNMPTGAMMIQMADNNPEQFKKYIKMMKNDPGFRVQFMKKMKDSERKEFADKLKTLKK